MNPNRFPLHLLQSDEQIQLLDDIDKLRSDGIQHHQISLPQLVVCGDQSSGKSSVLEAVSNVKFPVDEGTCTRFAMELALRRSSDKKATATITPGKNTSTDRQRRLAAFNRSDVGLSDVPALIAEARNEMGLVGDEAICDDVLRLEVTGPDLPHLTLVDLPGLIADAKDSKDIALVEDMVKRYMKSPRSIILAIISASTDKQLQKVLRLAREFDPRGERTVGIITKPDSLTTKGGSTSERKILELAKNQDEVSKLRLGWHVVRNLDYHEKRDLCDRDEKERELCARAPWNELDKWQLGIDSLRNRLTKHLFNHICAELPRVISDISREKDKCEEELKELGDLRISSGDQRRYLHAISGKYQRLVDAALTGLWESNPIFNNQVMRLRAQIRDLNDKFENNMRSRGHTHEVSGGIVFRHSDIIAGVANPVLVSRTTMLGIVDKINRTGRGVELPGLFNEQKVGVIFREESMKWSSLAHSHMDQVWKMTNIFLQRLLVYIAPAKSDTAGAIFREVFVDEMSFRKKALTEKTEELLTPYTRNLPFNYPLRMAASLEQVDREEMNSEETGSLPNNNIDIEACSKLWRHAKAYYNIALDTFVDNMATLAVENCLMTGLATVISPDTVINMGNDTLLKLAGESEKLLSDRRYAEQKSKLLEKSLKTCQYHMSRQIALSDDGLKGLAQELAGVSTPSSTTSDLFLGQRHLPIFNFAQAQPAHDQDISQHLTPTAHTYRSRASTPTRPKQQKMTPQTPSSESLAIGAASETKLFGDGTPSSDQKESYHPHGIFGKELLHSGQQSVTQKGSPNIASNPFQPAFEGKPAFGTSQAIKPAATPPKVNPGTPLSPNTPSGTGECHQPVAYP